MSSDVVSPAPHAAGKIVETTGEDTKRGIHDVEAGQEPIDIDRIERVYRYRLL